jgi:phosphoglycolate phosphatase-like HAD superfamily hydrolase
LRFLRHYEIIRVQRRAGASIKERQAVTQWKYRKIDLNQQRPRSDEVDLLNTAGAEGWELVSITSTNTAYLKRPIEQLAVSSEHSRGAAPTANGGNTNGNEKLEDLGQEVKPKYRDPATNDTWSGRGRMSNWLKKKQEAGEDIEKYLV